MTREEEERELANPTIIYHKCPFALHAVSQSIDCPYMSPYHTCGDVTRCPGRNDAWCTKMIKEGMKNIDGITPKNLLGSAWNLIMERKQSYKKGEIVTK